MSDKRGTLSKPTFQAAVERKSRHLMQARALEAAGHLDDARPLYLSVARDEEWIAAQLLLYASQGEAAVNLLSAASCWKKAGHSDNAVRLLDEILALPNVPLAFVTEVRELQDRWLKSASAPASNNTEEMIAVRAYHIYLERHGAEGSALDDWLRAEWEIKESGAAEVLGDAISRRAYHIYLERGGDDGSAVDDWLRAEWEVKESEAADDLGDQISEAAGEKAS